MLPDGFPTLSLAPLTPFEPANTVLEKPFYEVHAVSLRGGSVPSSFGMKVDTECAIDATFDTLLVGSAPDVRPSPPELISFLRGVLPKTRRIASICIGAFVLGEAGLLDGRRATTHWLYAKELQRRYPKGSVEADRIFIADCQIWTSTGMTGCPAPAPGVGER